MTELAVSSKLQSDKARYPPSWIDRFTAWIDNLPGPVWLLYALSLLAAALLINAVFWTMLRSPESAMSLRRSLADWVGWPSCLAIALPS